MPEAREVLFFYWVIKDFIGYCNRKSCPLNVLQLWIDSKSLETDGSISLPPDAAEAARLGMVFPLTKSMAHLTRGGETSVTSIFPSEYTVPALHRKLKRGETEKDICRTSGLVLKNILKHSRLVCLDLAKVVVHACAFIPFGGLGLI